MADKRMPADAARQMIESEKRKVQKQAVNMDTREEYRGFRLPPNMSAEEAERYKAAIDERENFRSKAARQLPQQAEDYVIEPIKDVGRSAADAGKSVLEAVTVVPRTKAAIAADPAGAKEFAKSVLSGDREAIRTAATEASEGAAEPFATMGDAALSLDAAERGEFGEAAGYAGLVVLPGVLQTLGKSMSKGWLKSATEAGEEIPDEAAKKLEDLAKRVDEGKITDDMQVRRELARVEDTYRAAYKGGSPKDFAMERRLKLSKKSIDDIDKVLPELRRLSGLNQAEIDKYADFRGKFMAQAAAISDRKFSDKEIEVLIDPFRSDAVRELSKTNPNIYGDLLTELRRAAAEDDRVADYLDRASAMNQMTKGGDAAGDIAGSLDMLQRQLKQYDPENLAESRKALDEATKAFNDFNSELRAAEDALKELEATRPEIVLRGEPGYDEWSDAVRKWNRANIPKRSALQKEIERITGDSYIEHTMQRGRFGSKLRNLEFQLDKARERVETLEKGPLENDNVRYYIDSLKDSVRGINSPDLDKETRSNIRRIIDDIEANATNPSKE